MDPIVSFDHKVGWLTIKFGGRIINEWITGGKGIALTAISESDVQPDAAITVAN